jgi:hypothetical protein
VRLLWFRCKYWSRIDVLPLEFVSASWNTVKMKAVKHDLKTTASAQRSKVEELISAAQATLYASLFLQNKDAEDGRLFSWAVYTAGALQWLAFPLSTSAAFPWDTEGHWAVGPINVLFDVLSGTTVDISVSDVRDLMAKLCLIAAVTAGRCCLTRRFLP